MFSLIITIISIALVAALAVATIYYGGSAFTQGTAKANAAALVSAAQQVSGAAALYANDNGGSRATTSQLTTKNYLASIPSTGSSGALTISLAGAANTISVAAVPPAVCLAIAQAAGGSGVTAVTVGASATLPFDCNAADAVSNGVFTFKG